MNKNSSLNISIFKLIGLWQLLTEELTSPSLFPYYLFHGVMMLIVFMPFTAINGYDTFQFRYELDTLVIKVVTEVYYILIICKCFYYCYRRKTLLKLTQTFETDFLMCHRHDEQSSIELLKSSSNLTNRVMFIYQFIAVTSVINFVCVPLINCIFSSNQCVNLEALPSWYIVDRTVSPVKEITYVIDVCVTMYAGITITSADCLFVAFVFKLTSQYDLLNSAILKMKNNVSKHRNDCLLKNALVTDKCKMKIIPEEDPTRHKTHCNEADKNYRNEMNKFLNDCLRDHQKIIRYTCLLEDVFKWINLFQMVSSTITICFSIAMLAQPLSSNKKPTLNVMLVVIKAMVFLLYGIMVLLAYSWCGSVIQNKSKSLSESLYKCDWSDCSKSFCMNVLIAMIRSQKSLTLTAGKFYDIDLDSFTSIMKASYSYFTVLYSFNSK